MSVEKDVKAVMAKAKGSLERIDEMEKQIAGLSKSLKQIAMAVNGALGEQSRGLEEYKEMLNAVIGILGPSQVNQEIENGRRLAQERQIEETKASIAQALAEGKVRVAEVTSPKSFVAGAETKADGTTIPPGWAFVPLAKIDDPYREQLTGKPVGTKVETKEGGFFQLLEIYDPVEAPAEVPAEVAPAAAAEAPAEVVPPTETQE